VIGFTQVFQAAQYVLSGALRGAGDTKFNMQVALWGVIIFRIIVTGISFSCFTGGCSARGSPWPWIKYSGPACLPTASGKAAGNRYAFENITIKTPSAGTGDGTGAIHT